MFTKIFPIALALAIAIGALTELAFTKTKVYSISDALNSAETTAVTVKGLVINDGQNNYRLKDKTGCILLETCPKWYREITLKNNEQVTVTGEIIKNTAVPKGILYKLTTFKIERPGKAEIVLRTRPGKPPWAECPIR